jgi:hypothetical protein
MIPDGTIPPIQVVLANGSVVQASATNNPDLFWALKGGGSNFGTDPLPHSPNQNPAEWLIFLTQEL